MRLSQQYWEQTDLPPPVNDARCRRCSLRDPCLSQVIGEPARLAALSQSLFVLDEEGESQ